MNSLPAGYSVEIDSVTEETWHNHLSRFSDANIYQTWPYGAVSWGRRNLSHLMLKEAGEVVAMAQLRIVQVPFLGRGVAYLRWGPLWRRRDLVTDPKLLRVMINALLLEYAQKRKLLFRFVPNAFREDADCREYEDILSSLNITGKAGQSPYRTLRLDISPSLEQVRMRLKPRWRNKLNRAEKQGLTLTEGTQDEFYDKFAAIYWEMMTRKQFETNVDVEDFRRIHQGLAPAIKPRIFMCHRDTTVVSAIVVSALGDTGIYLLGATGNDGLDAHASYLLHWRAVEWLKEQNCRWYDLCGINPEKNPGGYQFKSGMNGEDVSQLGRFEFAGSRLSQLCVDAAEKFRALSLRRPVFVSSSK